MFAAIDDCGKLRLLQTRFRDGSQQPVRWATGTVDKDFRIDVAAGIFARCEEKNSERVVGFRGFGHEYEKAGRWGAKELLGTIGSSPW